MSILGKFLGKKKDDFGLGDLGKDPLGPITPGMGDPLGSPGVGTPTDPLGLPPSTAPTGNYSPESMGFERVDPKEQGYIGLHTKEDVGQINIGKDLEIISAKLDAIKAELDSMNQRMKRLERIAEGDKGSAMSKDQWSY